MRSGQGRKGAGHRALARWSGALLIGVAALSLGWPSSATPATAPSPRVAFLAERNGYSTDPLGLWILEDGRIHRIGPADDPYRIWQAVWSPDGSRLLVTYYFNSLGDLGIIDPAQGEQAKLTSIAGNNHPANPAWSPDGTTIAWNDYGTDTTNALWIAAADGSGAHQYPAAWPYRVIEFTPDSQRLLVVRTAGGSPATSTLGTIALDGTQFSPIGSDVVEPSWIQFAAMSPDGTRVAYTVFVERTCEVELRVRRTDGTGGVQVLDTAGADRLDGVDWTSDGRHVVFAGSWPCPDSGPQRYSRVYEASLDGAAPRQLTFAPEYPGANHVGPALHGQGAPQAEIVATPATTTTTRHAPTVTTTTAPASGGGMPTSPGPNADAPDPGESPAQRRMADADLPEREARLLRAAEAALRGGDEVEARRLLEQIARSNPEVEIEALAQAIGLPDGLVGADAVPARWWVPASALALAVWLALLGTSRRARAARG